MLGTWKQHADPSHPAGLLRVCREWPRCCCRAAEQREELTASHLSLPRLNETYGRNLPHRPEAVCELVHVPAKQYAVAMTDVRDGSWLRKNVSERSQATSGWLIA